MQSIHRIIKVGSSLAVVLPVHILAELNLKRGDFVRFEVLSDDAITIIRFNDLPFT